MKGPGCIAVRPFELDDVAMAAGFCERARVQDSAIEPFSQRLALIAEGPRALLPVWRVAQGEDGLCYGIFFAAQRQARAQTQTAGSLDALPTAPGRAPPPLAGQVRGARPASAPAPRPRSMAGQEPQQASSGQLDQAPSVEVYGAVDPALRRQGLGRQLFAPTLEWARTQPRLSLRSRVREAPQAAPGSGFLEAHGFSLASAQLTLSRKGAAPRHDDAPGVTVKPLDRKDERASRTFMQLTGEAYRDAPDAFESRADELAQLVSDLGRVLLLGYLEGKAAGYFSALYLGKTLAIEEVAVLPEARRYGVGRALLVEGLKRAREPGALLTVSEKNQAARALYRSLGFQQIGRRLVYEWVNPQT